MTSKQRAYLKGLAMNIDPIFQIGKGSLTPEVTNAIGEAFNTKELIKIAVLKDNRKSNQIISVKIGEDCQIIR